MKYKITKTSDYNEKSKPCRKAFKGIETIIWKDGSKHDYEHWYININTLKELRDLIKEIDGELVINKTYIEVYDDYRE